MKRRYTQSGTSLIEVLVSMFVLSVLIALYVAANNTLLVTRKTTYEDYAYHVANKEMETLRDTSYDSLPATGTISDSMLNQMPSGSGSFTVGNYPGYSGIKEIVVTVSWNDGKAHQVVLKTLAGSGGINP